MQDDRNDQRPDAPMEGREAERDALGALIRAAGRRPSPSAEHYQKVFAATRHAWQRKVRARQRRQWAYALAATLAAVAIGLATFLQLMPAQPVAALATVAKSGGGAVVLSPETGIWQPLDDPSVRITHGSRLRTDGSGRASLDLSSGISVRVNSRSELTFLSPQELELMAGAVYVDAGPDAPARRFAIETAFGTIRDVGTQFEVNTSPHELRVRIREGLVQLYQSGQQRELEGVAGEEVRLDRVGTIERRAFSPYDPEWSWAEALAGTFEVDGQSLLVFLNWVARETGRVLRFDEPTAEAQARGVILHGSAQDLTPMQALDFWLPTTDFEYTLLDDGAILIRRRGVPQ
jgi:ferric-dicitrate binding protein FerR (iron transport regulator)